MAVKTEKELNQTQRSHWLKAVAAVEVHNFDYAISLLQEILKQEPEFLTGRELLRRTEVTESKASKKSRFNISTAPLAVMKAQREAKRDPKRAIELIEEVLADEPYNKQANLVLKEAALVAGWPEIGVFALRTLLEENPRDTKVLHELARLHHELGENQEEVAVYNRLTEINPLDAEAIRLGKDASARASMKSGGWGQASSYRDLIKDQDPPVSVEQQDRMKLTGQTIDQQIAETYAAHQAQPKDFDLARRLGSLNEQKEDIEAAIAWYRYAVDLSSGTDTELTRKVSELEIRLVERDIATREQRLAANPDNADLAEDLGKTRKKRVQLLIAGARERLNRNPTDLQLRFELGEQLTEAEHFREALPELQRARESPNTKLKAMSLLGRCYSELGMLDLAAKQLEEASREISSMDTLKKQIVYDLGIVYERIRAPEKALDCMKQIYEADCRYKDVAERVEASYRHEDSGRD